MKRLYLPALLVLLILSGMVMTVYATNTTPAPGQPIVGGSTPTYGPPPYTMYDRNDPNFKSFVEDGRLGWFIDNAAVYPTTTGIFIYDIVDGQQGELVLFASADDLEKAAESQFSQEVARTVGAEFRIFVLESGEYQVNVGPDDEYYLYTVIWRGLEVPHDVKFVRDDVCELLGLRQRTCNAHRNPFARNR